MHPAVARATTVPALLEALQTSGPGPRLTWYGGDGERVELSGRVLANWVAKTANLLREEFDVDAGEALRVKLPVHWRRVVVELAASALGARVTADADLLITATPHHDENGQTLAVALPALARAVEGPLHGALDYNAEVSGQDDVFVPQEPADLPPAPELPAGARVLLTGDDRDLLGRCLAVWKADGSVVLAGPGVDEAAVAAEGASTWSTTVGG